MILSKVGEGVRRSVSLGHKGVVTWGRGIIKISNKRDVIYEWPLNRNGIVSFKLEQGRFKLIGTF